MKLALDKSARTYDAEGRLHVALSHISKATVSPYYGSEIPADGLQPDKVYMLLRDPDELAKGAPTFRNIQILFSKHVPVSADDPQKDLIVGSIGSDVEFNAPYLDASLCVWDAEAIAAIESGDIKELSCAYRYEADMTPGEYEGQPYDGVMRNIQGNHLSIVEVGRAGPDVVVGDSLPQPEVITMTKKGKALLLALQAVSPKLAQDKALPALVGSGKPFDRAKLYAMDADVDSQQLDNIIDAILDVEQSPDPMEKQAAVGDASNLVEYLKSCGLNDEQIAKASELATPAAADEEPEDDDEKFKAAMDSMRAEFKALDIARQDVRETVGDVYGMDSADAVYRFALDHLKVDHADVVGGKALRAMYLAVSKTKPAETTPKIAADSSLLNGKLKRFVRM